MGPVTQRIIITLAFAAALTVPALAGLARGTSPAGQHLNQQCWELVTPANAGAMFPICSTKMHW